MNGVTAVSNGATAAVEKVIEGIISGNPENIAAVMHPDMEVVEPTSLPYGGHFHSRAEFFEKAGAYLFGKFVIGVGNARVFNGGESFAVAQMDLTLTSRRTGGSIMMPYVEVYKVQDDLVTGVYVYPQDTAVLGEFMGREA